MNMAKKDSTVTSGNAQTGSAERTALQVLAEKIREAVFNQHNLFALAKTAILNDDMPTAEALTISIGRFSDDIHSLYKEMKALADSEASKGGEQ
jgi:hypothetical protein